MRTTSLLALLLLIIGLGFKVAAVPFHMWTPDAYQGAPTPVSAYMSVIPKTAGFAAMVRILVQALEPMRDEWIIIVGILAVITMFFGNMTGMTAAASAGLFYNIYLFRQAFEFLKMGYASAMAWILFIIILILTLIQIRFSRRWVYYEGS